MRFLRFCMLLALSPLSCVGTTGGDLLEVQAYAAGPADAAPNLSFETGTGYRVSLSEARIFVGGVYLNRSRPTSVASDTSCSLPGIYVAQVLSGREIDLLSAELQAFPGTGFATSELSSTGEVWLSDGDVNRAASSTAVLRVSGSAERHGVSYPFEGKLTIGQNRVLAPSDSAVPGQHPICKQRIVSPISVDLRAAPGEALLLRVDPRAMFGNVDFATLSRVGEVYRFADQTGVDQASDNLYAGLRRSSGVYDFSWISEKK
jgi:hypothetical protein